MAQFVLTITSDSAEEIASFLSPGHATQARPNEPLRQEAQEQPVNTLQQPSSEEPKRKGRPPKEAPLQPLSCLLYTSDAADE